MATAETMGFIFDQNVLHEVAQTVLARKLSSKETFQAIADELARRYPGHINTKPEWVFNNAGGAMGAMWVLHASITEYVIIFGTPVGTEVRSRRLCCDGRGTHSWYRWLRDGAGSYGPLPGGRLLYHPRGRAVGLLAGPAGSRSVHAGPDAPSADGLVAAVQGGAQQQVGIIRGAPSSD